MHFAVQKATLICGDQLLILGAGLDNSYSTYVQRVFHVDYENVISDKSLSQAGSNVSLVAADISDLLKLQNALSRANFDFNKKTTVLIECVLCYLHTEKAMQLLSWISTNLSQFILIIYNPILPSLDTHPNSYSNKLMQGFIKSGAPILCPIANTTEHYQFLSRCSIIHNSVYTMEQMKGI